MNNFFLSLSLSQHVARLIVSHRNSHIFVFFLFSHFRFFGHVESVKAVNPFIDRIPSHEHEEFFEDYVDWVAKLGLILDDLQTDEKMRRIIVPYKLLVAYARK